MHRHPERDANRLELALSPTDNEFIQMIRDLDTNCNPSTTCKLLGIDATTRLHWLKGRFPSKPARKAVWLIWALVLHPYKLTSLWDIATWGRYHRTRKAQQTQPATPVCTVVRPAVAVTPE